MDGLLVQKKNLTTIQLVCLLDIPSKKKKILHKKTRLILA